MARGDGEARCTYSTVVKYALPLSLFLSLSVSLHTSMCNIFSSEQVVQMRFHAKTNFEREMRAWCSENG